MMREAGTTLPACVSSNTSTPTLARPAELDRPPVDERHNRTEQQIPNGGHCRGRPGGCHPRQRRLARQPLDLVRLRAWRHELEARILDENRLLELAELAARLDPELLHEHAAGLGVGVERFRLASRAEERQHQLRAQPLAQWVPGDQVLELADDRAVLAGRQRVGDGELVRAEPELLEATDLGGGERLVREIVERGAAPQRKRLARLCALPAVGPCCLGDHALEAGGVDTVGRHAQLVAAPAGEDLSVVAAEQLAQMRDVQLHHLGSARRRVLAPQTLDQSIGGDRRVGPERQHRQHRTLLGGAERDRAIVEADLDQTEKTDFHG